MLESLLKPGDDCDWLPTAEAGVDGTGVLCSIGHSLNNQVGVNYRYLPFVKNGINFVHPQGMDVISYNFTGCTMAVFKHNDGTVKVCHVSTGVNQDCLAEWANIKGVSTQVFAFRPSDFIDTKGKAFAGCYGLITNDLRTLAITVTQAGNKRTVANVAIARLLRD